MNISPALDWKRIAKLAKDGKLPVGHHAISKAKTGKQEISEATAIAIHLATSGEIPCWVVRPDTWQVGQVPPALASVA